MIGVDYVLSISLNIFIHNMKNIHRSILIRGYFLFVNVILPTSVEKFRQNLIFPMRVRSREIDNLLHKITYHQ